LQSIYTSVIYIQLESMLLLSTGIVLIMTEWHASDGVLWPHPPVQPC